MYNLHPVFSTGTISALLHFCGSNQRPTETCSPFIFVLQPEDVHELHSSRLAACVFHTRRKIPRGKSGTNWFSRTDFHDSGTNLYMNKLVLKDRFPRFRHQSVELG